MHSKTKQEEGSKHLFHIRFMQKEGKTDKLITMKQTKKRLLLIISNFFFLYPNSLKVNWQTCVCLKGN